MRKFCLILLLLLCCYVYSVEAKVWLLPDYQSKQVYSHRINGGEQANIIPETLVEKFSCYNYSGWKPLSTMPAEYECTSFFYGPETCCKSWGCIASKYPYTAAYCTSSGKIADTSLASCTNPDGTAYYQRCKCDTSKYPYIASNCSKILYGSTCSDYTGTRYNQCIDACTKASKENVCIASCTYGCNRTYSGCSSCCTECKTCVKQNCTSLGYNLNSCPANTVCESCTPGCGDSTKYYKATGCATNYFDPDTYWCNIYC